MQDLYKNILKCVSERIYLFENHKWKRQEERSICNFIKNLIENNIIKKNYKLFNQDQQISLQNQQFKNLTISILSNMFYDSMVNFIDKLDTDKYLLGFDNGVYDLKTHIFRDGLPTDLISISVGYNYIPKYSNNYHDLLLFLKNIQPDEQMLNILLRETCECLSGGENNKKTIMFSGINAGKSTYNRLISNTFGNYHGSFYCNLLTKSQPEINTDLLRFVKKRIMMCNWDSNKYINLITHESIRKSSELPLYILGLDWKKFVPICKMMIICDDTLPIFNKNNDIMYTNNVSLIEFPSRFVENPTKEYEINDNPHMYGKVMNWKRDFMLLLFETYKQNFQ